MLEVLRYLTNELENYKAANKALIRNCKKQIGETKFKYDIIEEENDDIKEALLKKEDELKIINEKLDM